MNKGLLIVAFAGVSLAYACGADPLLVTESDAVITIEAEGTNYAKYGTYYLPSEIVDLCLQPQEGTPTSDAIGGAAGGPAVDPGNCYPTDHTSDEAILDAFEANLEALGYERVSDPDDADVALLLGHVSKTSWNLGQPYCYPNYYFSGCVSQENNPPIALPYRALVAQMVDLEASSGDDLETIWTAGIHQVQRIDASLGSGQGGAGVDVRSTIWEGAIRTAFDQSPYLRDGGNN